MTKLLGRATIGAVVVAALCTQPLAAKPREGLRAVAEFNDACGTSDTQSFLIAALLSALIGPVVKAGVNGLGAAIHLARQALRSGESRRAGRGECHRASREHVLSDRYLGERCGWVAYPA